MMTDPIADMLTRIRNAISAGHDRVEFPASKIKAGMCKVLKEEGYIRSFKVIAKSKSDIRLKVLLKDWGCPHRVHCHPYGFHRCYSYRAHSV